MTPEGKAKAAIVKALEKNGIQPIRVQSGRVRVKGGMMHCAPTGTPDFLVMVPPHGRCLWLEVKAPDGTESDEQIEFARKATRLGAVVRTVRTPAEALRAYVETVNDG